MMRFVIRSDTREGDLERDSDDSLLEGRAYELDTVVQVSLFTDAKATAEELAKAGLTQRGYWFDAYDADPTLNTGSKLWLLEGRTINDDALADAKTYCDEALAWMVAEKAATRVENTVYRIADDAIGGDTAIYQPGADSPYTVSWEAYFAL
jgi:phage gp46-like protein